MFGGEKEQSKWALPAEGTGKSASSGTLAGQGAARSLQFPHQAAVEFDREQPGKATH